MKNYKKLMIALVALAFVILANARVPAGAAPNAVRSGATCRLAPNPAWTIVRVTVAPSGSVAALRIAYHSGNAAFNANALRFAAATSFGSVRPQSAPATFDYLIARDSRGKNAARIVARLGLHDAAAWTVSSPDRRIC